MRKLLGPAGRALTLLEDVMAVVAAVVLVLVTGMVVIDVAARKLASSPFTGTVQLAEYSMLYMTFLPIAQILRRRDHVTLDVLAHAVSSARWRKMQLTGLALTGVVSAAVGWYSLEYVISSFERHTVAYGALSVPQWLFLVVIPFGLFVLALESVRQLWRERGAVL